LALTNIISPLSPGFIHDRGILPQTDRRPNIGGMDLQLSDEQAAALERELTVIIEGDRYPFSLRIGFCERFLTSFVPEPRRRTAPEPKRYELPTLLLGSPSAGP
jgi:hypothetical protein